MRRILNIAISTLFVFAVSIGTTCVSSNNSWALEASTTLTVVNVSNWASPDCTGYTTLDDMLLSVDFYHKNSLHWEWDPAWPQYSNGVSARIWAIYSYDGGKTFEAVAWDWVGNSNTSKHLHGDMPGHWWVGTMFSTVCGVPGFTGCNYGGRTERSNVMFAIDPW